MTTRRQFGSIRRLPSGRWQARFRDPVNNRLRSAPGTFGSKAAASRYLATIESEMTRGGWHDPKRGEMTFAAWVDRYVEIADHKAATTRSRDETVLRTHLVPRLGELRLVEITPLDVQAVVNEMAQHLAPATVRTNYGVLRAVLNAAVDDERLARSPCRRIKLPQGSITRHRALEPEELHRLAAIMPTEYRLLVYIGGVLGLRWSELAGLRVGRMNVLGRTLEVAEAIKYVSGRLVDDGEVKSKAARRVLGMPEQLAARAAVHLAQRGLERGRRAVARVHGTRRRPVALPELHATHLATSRSCRRPRRRDGSRPPPHGRDLPRRRRRTRTAHPPPPRPRLQRHHPPRLRPRPRRER